MNRPLSTSTLTPEAWEPFETCRTTSLLAEKLGSLRGQVLEEQIL